MRTRAGTEGLTAIGPALCAFAALYDSKIDVLGPSPLATSFRAPSSSAQATCEFLDILAVGVVIRIGLPPANSYQPLLIDIVARSLTWANGCATMNGEAKTENSGKADGPGAEIAASNLGLSIRRGFGQVLHRVRFSFGEYGGNINVSVNNTLANVDNFTALNKPGARPVTITVLSGGFCSDKGVIELQDPMPDQINGPGQSVGGRGSGASGSMTFVLSHELATGCRDRSFPGCVAAAHDVAAGPAPGNRAGDGDPSPHHASQLSKRQERTHASDTDSVARIDRAGAGGRHEEPAGPAGVRPCGGAEAAPPH